VAHALTDEQRERAVDVLGSGMSLREAADICRVQWRDFEAYWEAGARDRQSGFGSEEAAFVEEALQVRAQFRAELKLKAAASAGKRAAADYHRLLERLDAEELPGSGHGNEIVVPARVFVQTDDPDVKAAAKRLNDAGIDMLEALTKHDRQRP
jgi:hypothetical protein